MNTMSTAPSTVTCRNVGVQNTVVRHDAGTAFPAREFAERGASHGYTCWPTDNPFDETEPAAVIKWIKRVERSESYAPTLAILCRRVEAILKANLEGH
jgi:hypothetical protein